jgi:hypothetical protein
MFMLISSQPIHLDNNALDWIRAKLGLAMYLQFFVFLKPYTSTTIDTATVKVYQDILTQMTYYR